MRYLSLFLVPLISLPFPPAAAAQTEPAKLNLVVVEGDGAINNIRQRTAREPIVQVEDENHKPVAGAVVVFLLPNQGASAIFPNGSHTLTVISDNQGRAVARGLRPNNAQGKFQIHVNASLNGQTASVSISQTNAAALAGGAVAAGVSAKLLAVLIVAGAAAAAGGTYWATHSGGGPSSSAQIPGGTSTSTISIAPGAGTVGAPR